GISVQMAVSQAGRFSSGNGRESNGQAAVAQLVERELPKLEVAGSRPVRRFTGGLCVSREAIARLACAEVLLAGEGSSSRAALSHDNPSVESRARRDLMYGCAVPDKETIRQNV